MSPAFHRFTMYACTAGAALWTALGIHTGLSECAVMAAGFGAFAYINWRFS